VRNLTVPFVASLEIVVSTINDEISIQALISTSFTAALSIFGYFVRIFKIATQFRQRHHLPTIERPSSRTSKVSDNDEKIYGKEERLSRRSSTSLLEEKEWTGNSTRARRRSRTNDDDNNEKEEKKEGNNARMGCRCKSVFVFCN
jgi:hypothetical protein